jgi:hypothetical protein
MIKRLLAAAAAVVACASLAVVAQTFAPNFPIVGGSSYCSQTTNASCVNTVPAGPAMTGNETVPADTNVAGNASVPTAVKITLPALGAGTLDYYVSVNGDTVTATGQTRQLIIKPAGTIAGLTVVFPAATALINGQRLGLCTTQIVTTLTTTAGSGTTVSNAPTALLVPVATGAGSCVEWIYRTADTTWYRTQ